MLPKYELSIVVKDSDVEAIVTTIMEAARTGSAGTEDIRLAVSAVYRIRTGESGEQAL
jgi:nitrogen regulatory protein PII